MVNEPQPVQSPVRMCMLGAIAMMAFQVAGKAARDALFLTSYRPSQLPPMVIAAALTAIVLSILQGRMLARFSPRRYVPWLLVLSATLQAVEWLTYDRHPGWSAIAVYVHVVSLGALITSGFWSVVNEQFDPWAAKQAFARIAGAGTAGGVAGGFLAERLAVYTPPQSILLAMCLMQLVTAAVLFCLPASAGAPASRTRKAHVRALDLLRNSAYFRQLSLLVLAGTFSAALLDYVLKADARHILGPGEPLLRFFALFHTGTALVSFLLQVGATSPLLNRFGPGAAMSTLPGSVSAGGLAAAAFGGLPAVTAARALEAVIRGSFFRAGYELLYTPMLPSEKRVIKSFNDVTVDRMGDALGGGFAQWAILLGPALSGRVMLITASLASAAGWLLSRSLHHGYVESLERSLEHYSEGDSEGDLKGEREWQRLPGQTGAFTAGPQPPSEILPALLPAASPVSKQQQWEVLARGDALLVAKVLEGPVRLERGMIPFVVPMLGNPALRRSALDALKGVASLHIGQFADYLFDPATGLEVRRRIPSLLAAGGGERAVDALLSGLHDPDAGIRILCGRALESLRRQSGIAVNAEHVFDAIRGEIRRTHVRSPLSVEHMFVLLAVVLPREPVRIAYEALTKGQDHLRGIALEYLETALPMDLAEALLEAVDPQTGRLQPPV